MKTYFLYVNIVPVVKFQRALAYLDQFTSNRVYRKMMLERFLGNSEFSVFDRKKIENPWFRSVM